MSELDRRGIRSRGDAWSVSVAVGLTVAAWELLLDRVIAPSGTRSAVEITRSLAVDGMVALLLARGALALAYRAFPRRVRGASPGVLGAAALSTVVLALLLVPAALVRSKLVEALTPAAAGDGDIDALSAGPVARGGWLCSTAVASATTDLRGDLFAATRTALILLPPALLTLLAALALVNRRWSGRRNALLLGAGSLAGAIASVGFVRSESSPPVAAAAACPKGGPVRSYDVSAIAIDLPLNGHGDHDPSASIYVLDSDLPAIQPLVIRAAAGECLVVNFKNRLDGPAAFHVDGLPWESERAGQRARPAGGAAPGDTIVYRIRIPDTAEAERAYRVHDLDDRSATARSAHGLFGAVVVEPRSAIWRDTTTGAPLTGSSWQAIVETPSGAFREFVVFHHMLGGIPALNGRSEPVRQRFIANGASDALAFSSYTYGDPATPVLRSYLGEPTKLRVVHGGGGGPHAFELHGGATRWERRTKVGPPLVAFGLSEHPPPDHAPWLRSDAQALDPGDAFEAEMDCGAGGCQRAPGDLLLRCRVQGHADGGEWGLWRVYDTLQPDLAQLPRRAAPPAPTTSRGLVGRVFGGKRVVASTSIVDPGREVALEAFVEAQLPPRGRPLHPVDATVWDWERVDGPDGPLYVGEPGPDGVRPPILFNPVNGRYAWPLLRPHLGHRPPFAGAGHTPAPWRGEWATASQRDGVCPTLSLVREGHRQRRVYSVGSVRGELLGGERTPESKMYHPSRAGPLWPRGTAGPRQADVLLAKVFDCIDVLYVDDAAQDDDRREHARPDLYTHFVKSDPQGSDGIAAGLAFSQHAEPYRASERTLARLAAAGDRTVELSHVRGLRPGIWIGIGLGEGRCAQAGGEDAPLDAPPADAERCTEIRSIDRIEGTTLALDAPLRHEHRPGEFADVEFVRFLWYSDGEYGMPLERDPRTGLVEAVRPREP